MGSSMVNAFIQSFLAKRKIDLQNVANQKKTDHGKVEELTEQKIDHDNDLSEGHVHFVCNAILGSILHKPHQTPAFFSSTR